MPVDWPEGHVAVGLTGPEHGECIVVTIHGVEHYLHSTTASELMGMLNERLTEWSDSVPNRGVTVFSGERDYL